MLATLTVISILASALYFVGGDKDLHSKNYAGTMIYQSSAAYYSPYDKHAFDAEYIAEPGSGPRGEIEKYQEMPVVGGDPHKMMYYVSGVIGVVGIGLAWWFHLAGRKTAAECRMDKVARLFGPIPRWAENKWYVDEFYHAVFRMPLVIVSHLSHWFDKLVIDGLVNLFGLLPRLLGSLIRPSQSGALQGYAAGMVGGVVVLLLVVLAIVARMGGAA